MATSLPGLMFTAVRIHTNVRGLVNKKCDYESFAFKAGFFMAAR